MTFDEVLREPSDKEKILEFCARLEVMHEESERDETFIDALEAVMEFIESL